MKTMDLRIVSVFELPDDEDLDAVERKMRITLRCYLPKIARALGGRVVARGSFKLDRRRAAGCFEEKRPKRKRRAS